jgi:hypothetical protein
MALLSYTRQCALSSNLFKQKTLRSSESHLLESYFWQCNCCHKKFNLVSLFSCNFFLSGFLKLFPLVLFPRHLVVFVWSSENLISPFSLHLISFVSSLITNFFFNWKYISFYTFKSDFLPFFNLILYFCWAVMATPASDSSAKVFSYRSRRVWQHA